MYSFNSTRPKGHGAVIVCIRGYFPPFLLNFSLLLFFLPFFGTLIGKSLKSMDIWKMLSCNKLQKQLQVYGSIKFDRVMVEPCEFNSQ